MTRLERIVYFSKYSAYLTDNEKANYLNNVEVTDHYPLQRLYKSFGKDVMHLLGDPNGEFASLFSRLTTK